MAYVGTDKRTGKKFVRVYAGKDPVTGRTMKPSMTLSADPTDDEVARAVEVLELQSGIAKRTGNAPTIGGLVAYYLESRILYGMSPTTVESYESNARCYVYPYIGSIAYDKATPAVFSSLYRELLAHGGRKGDGISQQTVKKLHSFLSGCFKTLSVDGVIEHSAISGVKTPKGGSPEAKALSERDFAKLRAHLERSDHPLDRALWLDLHTGVRRGELAGFFLGDYRPSAPSIRVARGLYQVRGNGGSLLYKDPKSKTSKRIIAVDPGTSAVVGRQIDYIDAMFGESGIDVGSTTPLFPRSDGSPHRPGEYNDRLNKLVKELHLDASATLHTFRHTHATYLLERGVNIKTVQERLGHSTIQTTLNIYGHVLEGRDASAAIEFADLSAAIGMGFGVFGGGTEDGRKTRSEPIGKNGINEV